VGRSRRPILISVAAFTVLAVWTGLVFNRGTGFSVYLIPGSMSIAAAVHPCEPPEPYEAKAGESFDQAFVNAYVDVGIRCGLPQGFIALWLSAAFWMGVVPLAIFLVLRRTAR
jgi:hypothetical protein